MHGILAGTAVLVISSLGLFYLWRAAHEAQLDAVRMELLQLARTAATLVDGDAHRSIVSEKQAGSPAHLALLAPLVKFHQATSDIIYVYTSVLEHGRIYYVLGTDYLYRVPGDTEPPELIMAPHDTVDPTLRRALERHVTAVNLEPVKEAVRSYMSAYAPFFDRNGRFVGVVGVDMWVRNFDARIDAIRRAGIGAFAAVALLSVLTGFVVLRLSRTAQRVRRRDRVLQVRLAAAKNDAEARAQRSGDALLTVINDVLDYSKIEAGRMSIEQIDMDLQAVCDGVRAILQSAALERGVSMRIDYDDRLPKYIKGDPVRIRQVLLNLAGNAVKFTESGSVRIAVTQLDAARLKVSVIDTGIGIPSERLATLFQRYTQADSSTARRYGGTGLGLAISKTLVELMGGEIGALSSPGTGSTFWFVLPLRAAAPTEAAEPVPSQAPTSPERPRLLLVEDNFVNQRVALYLLAKLGYEVDVAQHGREAIDRLSRTRYRLVLMDCQMPEMDGFEATRLVRDPASRVLDHDVPIIAMTANAFPEDRARSVSCGMNDFLGKPVDPAMLATVLTKWLGTGLPGAGPPGARKAQEGAALKTGS